MKLKDNKIYRFIVIPICIALCFFGRFIPPIGGLSSDAIGVICIFVASLILRLTIGIDRPSLLCIFSLGFLENVKFSNVLSTSFGNSTFIFLLFTFICTYALSKTSLIKRIAISFVDLKIAKKNGFIFIILFLLAVLLLGLFISPSVLFVVILPILNEIFEIAGIEKGEKVAKVLLMGLGFTVSISSGMTTIAHVFPILALNAAKIEISPIQYMVIAMPVGLILFVLLILIFKIFINPDTSKLINVNVKIIKDRLPKIDKKDIITLLIFVIVIILRIIPSIFKDISPDFYNAINQYGTAMPPILGTIALCILRVNNQPLISIEEAFKKGVPWSSLIMCAATLALGSVLTSDSIGIKAFLESKISGGVSGMSFILIIIIFALWAALQTNLSSNMVTATLVATVASTIIPTVTTQINLTSLVCVIGMLASFAFATPPSMPHIAIVAGSDYCSTKDVLLYGGIMMGFSVLIALTVGYPIGLLLF